MAGEVDLETSFGFKDFAAEPTLPGELAWLTLGVLVARVVFNSDMLLE